MAKQYSRSTQKTVPATAAGGGSASEGGQPGDGEEIGGVGSGYAAVLNERSNKSLNRNAGPERPSANPGMVPTVGKGVRKTGRI